MIVWVFMLYVVIWFFRYSFILSYYIGFIGDWLVFLEGIVFLIFLVFDGGFIENIVIKSWFLVFGVGLILVWRVLVF